MLLLRNDDDSESSSVSKLEEDEEGVQGLDQEEEEEEEVYSEDEYDKAGIGRPKRLPKLKELEDHEKREPSPLRGLARAVSPSPRSFSPSVGREEDEGPVVVALTTLPFKLSAVVCASTLPAHVKQTDLRVDVFCTPLNIALSSLDIITIIDAVNDIVDIFAPKVPIVPLPTIKRPNDMGGLLSAATATSAPPPPPRVAVLSPLCRLHLSFTLDHLNLSLLSDRENDSTPMVTETLRAFATISLSRGSASHAVSYSRELALKRLQKLAFPWAAADSVLTLIAKGLSKGQGVEEALYKVIVIYYTF